MLDPTTSPTGSKPAALTSKNSLMDRSLVKSPALPGAPFNCCRRSRACCGSPSRALPALTWSCVGCTVLAPLFDARLRIFQINHQPGLDYFVPPIHFDDGGAEGEELHDMIVDGLRVVAVGPGARGGHLAHAHVHVRAHHALRAHSSRVLGEPRKGQAAGTIDAL